nr:Zgc:193505 [Danio rerio]
MSFFSGMLGNKGAESMVDQAVDKASTVVKKKMKETITGKKQPTDKTGGMGGLFPSSGDNKPKEKSGGLFGGLLSTEKPAENPPAAATSAADSTPSKPADPEFNDALDELANDF